MKDAVATMGDLLPDDAGGRDAVHVAVVSAFSSTFNLMPGQDIGLAFEQPVGRDVEASPRASTKIGIVDPYLKAMVTPGQRFWLYLYPRSITGLNHHWTHPAFSDAKPGEIYARPADKIASEKWLKDFCESASCPGYEAVMRVIKGGSYDDGDYNSGRMEDEYIHFNGSDAHGEIPDEFWVHVERVMGRAFQSKPKYFSCSC